MRHCWGPESRHKVGLHSNRSTDYLDLTSHYGYYTGYIFPKCGTNCLDHVIIKSKKSASVIVCESGITDHDSYVWCLLSAWLVVMKLDYDYIVKDVKSKS